MAEAIDQLMVKLGLDVEQEQFQQAESQFSSLQSTALQFGALIGGGLGLKEFTFDFADAIGEMSRFADVWEGLEVTPQFVNEMQGVFAMLRDDASQAMPFIENLGKIIEDTDWGNFSEMALAEGFNIAGLQDAETAMEAMTAINEQISKIAEEDPERARRITQHLGFSDDAGMILRNQDLGAVREQSRELRPMTNEMVEAADEFNRGWAELSRAMTSLKDQISVSFVGDLGTGMQDLADAIAENREAIVDFAEDAMPALTSIAAGIGTLVISRVGGGILGALRRSEIPGIPLLAAGATFVAQTGGGVEEQREKLSAGEGESAVRDQMDARELMRAMPEELSVQAQQRWMQGGVEVRREILQTNNITIQGTENPEATARAVNRELERAADNTREDTRSEAQ